MQITKCDKCKKGKPQNTWGLERYAPWVSGSVRGQDLNLYFDLCEKCGKGFVEYVKKFFGIRDDTKKT